MKSVRNSLDFLCVFLVVSPLVLVVAVPLLEVNVVRLFALIRIVNLLSRRPCLSPENAKRTRLWSETDMNTMQPKTNSNDFGGFWN